MTPRFSPEIILFDRARSADSAGREFDEVGPDSVQRRTLPGVILAASLLPASWIYAGGGGAVRVAKTNSRVPCPAGTKVVSVGNLEAGGAGKTPLAMAFLESVCESGRSVAYLSRGYRGRSERSGVPTLVVPSDLAIHPVTGARVISRGLPNLAEEIGDEAALAAWRCPWAWIAVGACKEAVLPLLVGEIGAEVVVVDDAFQSWSLPRSLDIVLVDAARPFGDGRVLPSGRLRERPAAIARADVVGVNGAVRTEDLDRVGGEIRRRTGTVPRIFGMRRTLGSFWPDEIVEGTVLSVSGVARAAGFERDLRRCGLDVCGAVRFRDHHRYTRADASVIGCAAERAGAETVVTTEKDWVKLARWCSPDGEVDGFVVRVARLELDLFGDVPSI